MKICTMFAFEGVADADLLHCTHKFFREEPPIQLEQVLSVLRAYFARKPFQPFQVPFTKLTTDFGSDGTYRVVEPESKDLFLLDLKAELDLIQPDSWPDYRPHVTVGRNTDQILNPVRDYVVLVNHQKVWSAVESMASLTAEVRGRLLRAR